MFFKCTSAKNIYDIIFSLNPKPKSTGYFQIFKADYTHFNGGIYTTINKSDVRTMVSLPVGEYIATLIFGVDSTE